jgi:hypothetical protein
MNSLEGVELSWRVSKSSVGLILISKSISQSSHMLHLVCWDLDFGFV